MFRAGMLGELEPAFRSLATFKLVVNAVDLSANFKPKRTAAASRGFLATARLSCCFRVLTYTIDSQLRPWLHVK